MNPSRPFILRPVATSLLMAGIFLAGVIAYRLLSISALPQIDYPTIQVVTLYPGASPDVMTSSITAPLERQFGQMPGLSSMASTSSGGASLITLTFDLVSRSTSRSKRFRRRHAASNLLPTDSPLRPSNKVNPPMPPFSCWAHLCDDASADVEDLVDTAWLRRSPSARVGLVSISGGQRPPCVSRRTLARSAALG